MYYRVVNNYLGEEVEFKPEYSYEKVDMINNEIVEVDYSINEVCFSKGIENCFFAISLFLEEDKDYYIYKTDCKPCIDLSDSSIGDFKACKEVRYRKPVKAVYVGKFNVDDWFCYVIKEFYRECSLGEDFNNEYALKRLEEDFSIINAKII